MKWDDIEIEKCRGIAPDQQRMAVNTSHRKHDKQAKTTQAWDKQANTTHEWQASKPIQDGKRASTRMTGKQASTSMRQASQHKHKTSKPTQARQPITI